MQIQDPPRVLVNVSPQASRSFLSSIHSSGGCAIIDLAARERDFALKLGAFVRINGDLDDSTIALLQKLGSPPLVVKPASDSWLSTSEMYDGQRIAEIVDIDEARIAEEAGVVGVIARGNEAAGRGSDLSTFVLTQQLRKALPEAIVWAQGGIGLYTTRGVAALGAHGVVLDEHVALLPGAGTDDFSKSRIKSSLGVRTQRVNGIRTVVPPFSKKNSDQHTMEASETLFLADDYLQRFRSVRRVVREFVRLLTAGVVPHHVADWIDGPGLIGSPLVIQGPMTRVSDQPQFARAVAAAGGLPTIALGSLGPSDARDLLDGTARTLDDLPWAAGVLGFLPEELLESHMSLIEEVLPKFAILAGGNVEQAQRLEKRGIHVMLHCPSPVLLKQMISSGHRSFIFEGNECGGHIGPSTSFALWEQQFTALEEVIQEHDIDDLEITLAGGIHDAASAAAAIESASPLQELGIQVNLLLGTAYLFTVEAVKYGVITSRYQTELLGAQRTSTITTAPGHTTRCLDTPFAHQCEETRTSLKNKGEDDRAIWAALEEMNLGRLRLAAKGLERRGDDIVSVDGDYQSSEGLFMAGDVAILHDAKTTVRQLHEEITEGARRHLECLVRSESTSAHAEKETVPEWIDIAIVGMAGVFPGAPSLAEYWELILSGRSEFRPVPESRWLTKTFMTSSSDGRPSSSSNFGAFLPPIEFDPTRFGIPPNSLASIDPAQILALKVASDALDEWGYLEHEDKEHVSVVFGVESGGDLASSVGLRTLIPHYLGELPKKFDEVLPPITPDSFPGMLANICSGRVTNRLDLGGLNCTVDAACGSSIAALNLAIDELILGRCKVALAGGVDLHNAASDYVMFSSLGALSSTGEARVFDENADGIVLGEGAGCVVLKRLTDAERDGDPIHAVIRGIGTSSDGRALGLTAPRIDGQVRAFDRAYTAGRIDTSSVGLIEAHGTGTVVGDRAEVTTVERFFGQHESRYIRLGSVKAQIGHTKCAAGIAGLIKAVLCVEKGTFPAQPALSSPLSEWNPKGRVRFQDRVVPWVAPTSSRVAGISAFGFGGTNYHMVIAGHEGNEPDLHDGNWPAELVAGWGTDLEDALDRVEHHISYRQDSDTLVLIAERCWRSRRTEYDRLQFAAVSTSIEELSSQLKVARSERQAGHRLFLRRPSAAPDKQIVGLFPGQGSQSLNMLADLLSALPFAARRLQARPRVADLIYPGRAFSSDIVSTQKAALTDTTIAQPALLMCSAACLEIFRRAGVAPNGWIGHSLGELTALYAAGVLSYDDVLTIVEARSSAMEEAIESSPGTMLAVAAGMRQVEDILNRTVGAENVFIANDNSSRQVVLSGDLPSIVAAAGALTDQGIATKRLDVAGAFHSEAMRPAAERLRELLVNMTLSCSTPHAVVWSNRTASPYHFDDLIEEISRQVCSPVKFRESVRSAYVSGARVFVELGPKTTLSRLVQSTLDDEDVLCTGIEKHGAGVLGMLSMFAELLAEGISLDLGWLFDERHVRERVADHRRSFVLRDGRFWSSSGLIPNSMLPAHETQIGVAGSSSDDAMSLGIHSSVVGKEESEHNYVDEGKERLSLSSTVMPSSDTAIDDDATMSNDPWWEDTMVFEFGDDESFGSRDESREENYLEAYLRNMRQLASEQASVVELALRMEVDRSQVPHVKTLKESVATRPHLSLISRESTSPLEKREDAELQASRRQLTVPVGEVPPVRGLTSSSQEEDNEVVVNAATLEASASLTMDVRNDIKKIISDMTGYPVEMIDDGVDLEADLSIDSVKRMEIAGALLETFEIERSAVDGGALETLLSARSVDTVSNWIKEQLEKGTSTKVSETTTDQQPTVTKDAGSHSKSVSVGRTSRLAMTARERNLPGGG